MWKSIFARFENVKTAGLPMHNKWIVITGFKLF